MRILDGRGVRGRDRAGRRREALRTVDETDYDVVILDIMMPKIDGLEVLQRRQGEAPGHRRHHDHRAVADRDRGARR